MIQRPRSTEEIVRAQIRRAELSRQERLERGEPCPGLVVTISRRMGSGARIVARMLADSLGWTLWDRELLDAIANDAKVSREVVEGFDEKAKSEIERLVRSVLGDFETGGFLYARHLAGAVAAIARYGNAIILGRGANFVLPDALHIRIDASDVIRIRNMMSYENLTPDEAAERLRQSDRERHDFLVRTFGRDTVESAHYDLTIWMDRFTAEDAVKIIRAAIEARCARMRAEPR